MSMTDHSSDDITRRLADLEDEVRELRARVAILEDGGSEGQRPGPSATEEAPLPPDMPPPPSAFRPNPMS